MIRLAAALKHYVVDPFIAILLHDIRSASMYMKGGIRSIDLMISYQLKDFTDR